MAERRREENMPVAGGVGRLVAYRSGWERRTGKLPLKCFYSAIKLLDNCINAGQCLIKQFDCLFRAKMQFEFILRHSLGFSRHFVLSVTFAKDFSSTFPTISVIFGKYLHATKGPPPINIGERAFFCLSREMRPIFRKAWALIFFGHEFIFSYVLTNFHRIYVVSHVAGPRRRIN